MKVVVTGGAGFIGSAVIRRIVEATEFDVINLDCLTYAANLDNLAAVAGSRRYRFARVDIRDATRLNRLFAIERPDAVIHLAAESHVDRSIDGPSDFIETNIVGTYNLLEASRARLRSASAEEKARFRFLHVSTDEVFGSLGDSGLFREDSPYRPNSPYSASKAASDHLVRAWCHTFELPSLVTNCSNNYGPHQFPEKLIPLVVRKALAGERLPVYGKGENVRDWLYVDDHADALLLALAKGRPGETYNIGGGAERRNIDVVREICAVLDEIVPDSPHCPHERLIAFVEDRPGHDFRYAIDSSKIRAELGWRPRETFETGLRKTVEWYVANADWCRKSLGSGYRGERLGVRRSAGGAAHPV